MKMTCDDVDGYLRRESTSTLILRCNQITNFSVGSNPIARPTRGLPGEVNWALWSIRLRCDGMRCCTSLGAVILLAVMRNKSRIRIGSTYSGGIYGRWAVGRAVGWDGLKCMKRKG